jgi:hypothetical protein
MSAATRMVLSQKICSAESLVSGGASFNTSLISWASPSVGVLEPSG